MYDCTGMAREILPIHAVEENIVRALERGPRLIVQAPAGAGKSTHVPQMLLDRGLAGDGRVLVLQPRRLAARMLARRVAWLRGTELGAEVGCQMRFENILSDRSRIVFVTEGVLLRRMLAEPALAGTACIVFDEFHERHLAGDVTLARALQLQRSTRPDLRLVVMSATLATELVEAYLAPVPAVRTDMRPFPVAIEYLERTPDPEERIWDAAVEAFERCARAGAPGDVLIFMPGAYEIRRTLAALQASRAASECVLLPLYGDLPPREQDAALAEHDRRKIIVATNVAETSLTIPGVRIVIDSGLARMPRFDPRRGIDTLWIARVSRASTDQRAGRAGRTAPGRCVRLWTEREQALRPAFELPEIKRIDLSEAFLALKGMGIADTAAFPWLEAPEPNARAHAERLLADLGATGGPDGAITALGRRMLAFPVHPRCARMLIEAGTRACVPSVALIAALAQEPQLLPRARGASPPAIRAEPGDRSDFTPLMRAWHYCAGRDFDAGACRSMGLNPAAARRVGLLAEHFLAIARGEGLRLAEGGDDDAVCRCVLAGFADRLARKKSAAALGCNLVDGRTGALARESCARAHELFVAAEVNEIEGARGSGSVRLSMATAVREEWLAELLPDACSVREEVSYDAAQQFVAASRRRFFLDLEIGCTRSPDVPREEAARLLAGAIARGEIALPRWDQAAEQWIARVNCLAAWCPEHGIAPFGEEDKRAVLEQLCWGATAAKEVADRPVLPLLKAWHNPGQVARIERLAPEDIRLPRGRRAKITYAPGAAPFFAARIQDLYDAREPLAVAGGKVRLVIHVLAPSNRPVQITDDLAGFWRNHYPKLKQELKRRYWKHEWR